MFKPKYNLITIEIIENAPVVFFTRVLVTVVSTKGGYLANKGLAFVVSYTQWSIYVHMRIALI